MHDGYTQAEGVNEPRGRPQRRAASSRSASPETQGSLGGYAPYITICPRLDARKGVQLKSRRCAAAASSAATLHWDDALGYRVR